MKDLGSRIQEKNGDKIECLDRRINKLSNNPLQSKNDFTTKCIE